MATKKQWYTPLVNFLVHAIMGTLIFLTIGAPAVALSLLVHYLETLHVPGFTIFVLTFLEQAILLIDAIAVVIYVTVAMYRELKELLQEGED